MPGLKTILIYPEDIVRGTKHMHDKQGRYDLLGQILYTGYNIKIHQFAETPASQGIFIHPFTEMIRGRTNNTPLTMTLLRNADYLSPRKQIAAANELLEEWDIYLEEA